MTTQHYEFAHRALPSVTYQDAAWTLGVLNGPDAGRFLADLWEQAGTRCDPAGLRDSVGLHAAMARTGKSGLIATIFMPEPSEPGEAHITAIVAMLATPGAPSFGQLSSVRYFTLELGVDVISEKPCTYLCEWGRDGTHYNHGRVEAPTEEVFLSGIFEQMGPERGGEPS